MKDYELYSTLKIPKKSNIIIRLDGRSFHSLCHNLNLKKPYDDNFIDLMANVSCDLFKEFAPKFIYVFSDEINIYLDQIPFNGRIEKIDSIIASFASSSFSLNFKDYFDDNLIFKPFAFDSRVIPISNDDIVNYFKWRQDEAWLNCVNAYGIYFLKSKYSTEIANKKINGLKQADIHELLFKNGINLNNVKTCYKRGIAIYKKNNIYKDINIPIFTKDFFNEINIL